MSPMYIYLSVPLNIYISHLGLCVCTSDLRGHTDDICVLCGIHIYEYILYLCRLWHCPAARQLKYTQ